MKRIWKRLSSVFLTAAILLSMAISPVMAAGEQAPPTTFSCSSNWGSGFVLDFGYDATGWSNAITGITVDGSDWSLVTSSFLVGDDTHYYISSSAGVYIGEAFAGSTAVCVISADGYRDLTLCLDKSSHKATVVEADTSVYEVTIAESEHGTVTAAPARAAAGERITLTVEPEAGYLLETLLVDGVDVTAQVENSIYTFVMPEQSVNVSASFQEQSVGKLDLSQVTIEQDSFGRTWNIRFQNADGYADAITGVSVNGTAWEESAFSPNVGGVYQISSEGALVFAEVFFGTSDIPVLQSGDVITISAENYEDLVIKLVINQNGNASLTEDDGLGDPYQLHVKIVGSFEAAIVGQKDYDGVSSASTGGASSNQNSAVTVYGALVEQGEEPTDSDWAELDHLSAIQLEGSKCSVQIVPDTEQGTPEGSNSGMEGIYAPYSSALTLNGTPTDPGCYLISVSIADNQGRTATSNTLPFRIYTGEETLADQLVLENLKQYENGLYAWDIMEPWAIKNFGSNVAGAENSVRVPEQLEAWFGSHTSGTYGYLGYSIPWADVQSGTIPQTLYIPNGCDLTITNMEILSSVRIVVESGGKLTLSDSVVQGIIDVQNGGIFSMNYDSYSQTFQTGASLCGQLRLADGAILENAAIYSHTNYLANGDLTDRSNAEAVVATTGTVTVQGQVFIHGDEAGGTEVGQTALRIEQGTVELADGAVLVTYGGGGNTQIYPQGGTAIQLKNGSVTGNGKVVAIGGSVTYGNGGHAISGEGAISAAEAFLQGATAYGDAVPGSAVNGTIRVTSRSRHTADGEQAELGANDPLEQLAWKTGIDAVPPLDQFVTEAVTMQFTVSEIEDMIYTGSPVQPVVVVRDESQILTEGLDYVVSYQNADGTACDALIDIGTYTVVVIGQGDYTGVNAETSFMILPDPSNDAGSDSDADLTDPDLDPSFQYGSGWQSIKQNIKQYLSSFWHFPRPL